jgi:pimeloyl-ACP methyl ester carboxylesterase
MIGDGSSMAERAVRWNGGAAQFLHLPGESSAGTPLIFLPGLLATSFCWRHSLPALSAVGACFAPDFPGLGGSDAVARLGGIAGLAIWARGFAAALQLGPVAVVASSWGGAAALRWALDAPQEVRALVLAAPANPFFHPVWRQRVLLRSARLAGPALRHMPDRWHAQGLGAMFADPRRLTPEAAAGYRRPLRRRGLGRILAGYVTGWRTEMAAMEARLPELRAPTLLIWGARDRIVPIASAQPLQAALAHAELLVLADAGHAPFEEQPEAFNAAVIRFLCSRA